MKISVVVVLLFNLVLCIRISSAQENLYDISNIPDALLIDANAVVRNYNAVFEIQSIENATLTVHYAITILNKSAIEHSYFIEGYNKFFKIRNIKAEVFDDKGFPIKNKKIKKEDVKDYSAIANYSLYEDSRVKFIDPEIRSFPFTVEYSYQIHFDGFLNLPHWQLFEDYNLAVENSAFRVITPNNYAIRFLERNDAPFVDKTNNGQQNIYVWDTSNVQALRNESFSPQLSEKSPVVYLAPNDFKIGGYKGNCESWENFGEWISLLNEDKDILPEDAQNEIYDVIDGVTDDYEKARLLYEYFQNKTRYVSVQVGIGGWQPMDAESVHRLNYGDCKALTNYMKSILKVAGIDSYYTLVYAGTHTANVRTEFPSNQFNHVILCLPLNNDTTWLECTGQSIPFGYIGTFTESRNVLVINDKGGEIVSTLKYNKSENQLRRNAEIKLYADGNCSAHVKTKYKGLLYDDVRNILTSDEFDRKKLVYEKINIPSFELIDFKHNVIKDKVPYVDEELELRLNNYAVIFGDRMMIELNLMNTLSDFPEQDDKRTSDIVIQRSSTNIDTIIYTIPDGFIVEDLPEWKLIESEYGQYYFKVNYKETKVEYVRYLSVNKGVYPKEDYCKFLKFYNDILSADKSMVVLKKI